ncbi:MAG: hypothetical protein LC623_00080 [Halobacteriales archaeon]|nr:hypothetical protein [Halobacteriales archaeon]
MDGVVLAYTDISERKERVTVAQQIHTALEATARKLAASNAQLEELASVASHDLREPLRMVASYLQLLQEQVGDRLDAEETAYLQKAVGGAARMQRLIHDLLAYAKLQSKEQPTAPVALAKILEEAEQNLRVTLKKTGATVTQESLPMVAGEPSQLVELFQNLLANAVKFRSEAPPTVHVSAARSGASWQISVRDNGIGIEAKDQKRLFRLFQRVRTKKEYPGTGLGLAICKKIVESHGGRIWVESVPGKGATFCFLLPALPKEAAA